MANSLKIAAQAGDVKALEALMNNALKPKEVIARVTNSGSTLKISLNCSRKPDPQLKSFVKRGLQSINPKGFEKIWIVAKVIHGGTAWDEKLSWDTLINTTVSIEEDTKNTSETKSDAAHSSSNEQQDHVSHDGHKTRKAYQFLQVRVQLLGRGMTNEIMNLYVNGKRLRPKVKTLHEFLNFLGAQGFQVVTAIIETEGIYTHFYTLQREVFTYDIPDKDIYDVLEGIREGADFGDSIRNVLEFGLLDNF